MSVNLYSFVENPFTDKAYFNYDKFKEVVYKAQRLMDDVIDLENEKIDKIIEKISTDPEPDNIKSVERDLWIKIRQKLLDGRRTGLSAIGLADCFASLGISYGSNTSIELAEEIYKQFAISAYKSSIDMAKERGAFPIWNNELEHGNPFLHRLFGQIEDDYKYFYGRHATGRRNIALLTIPPSGTISLMAGISSGIEPVFNLYYKRRRKLEKGDPKITFVDQNGDGWEEYLVFHPKFKEYCEISAKSNNTSLRWDEISDTTLKGFISESPYLNATANEIDPIQRVRLQAAIQKWIDHSISSTINLPEDTTESTIASIYLEAWESGCKGITVYRENSRTGVLVSAEDVFPQYNAPKRPKILPGEAHSVHVKGEPFTVIVGLMSKKPYEVFAYRGAGLSGEGQVIKQKGIGYIFKQGTTETNITDTLTDEQEAITRGYSYGLRHGGDVQFASEQLDKTKGDLTTFSKAIARILRKYAKNLRVPVGAKCDECGSTNLKYESSCLQCLDCGSSKCG